MKYYKFVIASLMLTSMSFAQDGLAQSKVRANAGQEGAHGGDLTCDAKIQAIANNLNGWIREQGAKKGPLILESSLNPGTAKPYTIEEYNSAMSALLNSFITKPLSSCAPGPIDVDHADKICKSWMTGDGLHILCDLDRFPKMDADLQIQQIHHEFATNITGLEPDDGPLSTYKISIQLSGGMENVLERRLVAKPFSSATEAVVTLTGKKMYRVSKAELVALGLSLPKDTDQRITEGSWVKSLDAYDDEGSPDYWSVWKDENGLIWGHILYSIHQIPFEPVYTSYTEALESCGSYGAGARLPTAAEIEGLAKDYFGYQPERGLFPKTEWFSFSHDGRVDSMANAGSRYWTSTPVPNNPEFQFAYNADNGRVMELSIPKSEANYSIETEHTKSLVRCVVQGFRP